jgi:hypothetical protein
MANRPWITPADVKAYSDVKAVQERSDAKLNVDIARAEQYIITLTHNNFEEYDSLPEPVKTAALILAEAYAHNAVTVSKELESETFDDYSYKSSSTTVDLDSLDLAALLDAYTINEPKNGVNMRLRKL